jgi:hypothetical protein
MGKVRCYMKTEEGGGCYHYLNSRGSESNSWIDRSVLFIWIYFVSEKVSAVSFLRGVVVVEWCCVVVPCRGKNGSFTYFL